jgi:hypothetical protein
MNTMKCGIATDVGFVIALAFIVLPGCEQTPPGAASTPTITLNPGRLDMVVGETRSFDVGVSGGSGPSFTFSVSPASVATVTDSGGTVRVTCVSAGSAVITVSIVVNGRTLTADLPVVCRETTLIDVTPASLAFTHTVGSTGCPQQVGTFRVTNTAGFPLTISLARLNDALTVDVSQFSLEPGAFRDVGVGFNCSTQTSFVSAINVAASVPGRLESKSVQVTATINR